jgi:hypothetical protein
VLAILLSVLGMVLGGAGGMPMEYDD